MTEIKTGDIVTLKSSKGVLMTVKFVQPVTPNAKEFEACCQWFEDKTLREGMFPTLSLRKKEE
jgi:hypothetical protein